VNVFQKLLTPLAIVAALATACTAPSSSPDGTTGSSDLTQDDGSYALYFTNPLPAVIGRLQAKKLPEYSPATADRWQALSLIDVAGGRNLHQALVDLMARASGDNCAVLVSDYDFNRREVADGMIQAKARGCDVRLITDGDTIAKADADLSARRSQMDPAYHEAFTALRTAGIEIHHDGNRGAIMHHKFAVVTGPTVASVWAGSWNFTTDDEESFWNNGIQINSAEMVKRYRADFEAMYTRFGADGSVAKKSTFVPFEDHGVRVGATKFEVYFPQVDKAGPRITELLAGATKSIHMLAFSFTSKEMTAAVVERARAGVEVRGVFENSGACSGAYAPLAALGAQNVTLSRWPYGPVHFMHHKVFVIDGDKVVFSSFNFSSSADNSNDENVLIVQDVAFAAQFEKAYQVVEKATALTPPPVDCKVAPPAAAPADARPDAESPPPPADPTTPSAPVADAGAPNG
jgi:phosphatidylserine/phosphatidylglycerophosphate/cardiolipin synthase-like enzyme